MHAVQIQDLLKQAKFVLAFENSAAKDYVSEKFMHALEAGALPVVYGTPNIRDFEPGPMSIIVADEFKSAADLGQYLLLLARNPDMYMRYQAWRRTGGTDKFKALIDTQGVSYMCRLCIALADKWVRRQERELMMLPYDHILVRERHTFYFRVVPKLPRTVMELHRALFDVFADITPRWACSAEECPDEYSVVWLQLLFKDHPREYKGDFRLYSVYPAYSTQEDAQRNPEVWLNTDAKVGALKSGDRLEVIFV